MKKIHYLFVLLLFLWFNSCRSDVDNKGYHSAEDETVWAGETVDEKSEIGTNIDRYLSTMESLGFSGAIIVSEGGEVVLRKGYGLADRESRRPYTPSTVQSHGSLTKQMTAAAILLLENRGELSVDDSIAKYFDDLPEDKRAISIHQLLTHSSGLPGGVGPDDEPIGAQAYLDRVMAEPLQFDPGSGYAYSNSGYALLGIIIERISGQSYESFLRQELLLPAGLTETGYLLPSWERDRLAIGYRDGNRWGIVYERGWLEDGPNYHLRANGGLHTTVDDMYRWWKATFRDQSILNAETVRRWTTAYVTESNGVSRYAYGWVVYETEWGPMIAHSGSNRIFSADFVWLPEPDLFFYIQGNTSMIAASRQRGSLLAAAFDAEFLMPPIVESDADVTPEEVNKRAGNYHLDGGSLELSADDTRLIAKLSGQSALDMMLKHTEKQKKQFSELNRRTRDAMDKLEMGQKDALADLLREGEDPVAPTGVLLNRIEQIGNLESLHVIGSFANTPGSRFAGYGPWTTFVYAEFANWNQYWNITWNSDGTYQDTRSGPWPAFILVPTAEGQYRGVRQGPPWDTVELHFQDGCLVAGKLNACKET